MAAPVPQTTSRPALLEIEDLRVRFDTASGTVRAVDGLSLSIAPGEAVALLGESGSGKSVAALTLLQLLPQPAGRIIGGRVLFGGRDLLRTPERDMRAVRGRRIAMIFQEPQTSLNPVMTLGDQIGEVLPASWPSGRRRERVLHWIDAVGLSDPARRCREYPHQLSGGMKQRAMIAMALAAEPELLVADEPTTSLDVTIQAQVLELLKDLQQRTGMAMLFITHDLGVASQVADRVAVMYAGEIVEDTGREAFFAGARHPYARKLFRAVPGRGKRNEVLEVIPGSVPVLTREFAGCRFAERCDRAWALCRSAAPAWRAESGHGVRCHLYTGTPVPEGVGGEVPAAATPRPVRVSADAGPPLLEVRDLVVHFPMRSGVFRRVTGRVRAVDGVSLSIPDGRTLALVGESGCGKTTVGKAILRLADMTSGEIRFGQDRLDRMPLPALRALRRRLQVIFQDPYASLDPRMPLGEILEEGMIAQNMERSAAGRRSRIVGLLEQVGLGPEVLSRYPHEFSGGQRQRLCIARALSMEPRLIICDEPTSALDVSVQAQILNLLRRLQEEMSLTYLFITHNLGVVEYLAHQVAVMYLGRLVESGPVEEVTGNPMHPYTRALLSAVPVMSGDGSAGSQGLPAAGLVRGETPSPVNPPAGCHYHPRCPQAMPQCRTGYPEVSWTSRTHWVRCHLYSAGDHPAKR